MSSALVEINHLSKVFHPKSTPALSQLSIELPKGQIIGLVGPDGAGKTTLIRLMAGLLLPTTGSITVAGFDTVRDPENIHRLTGYMPQRFGLYEDLTTLQNLELYADLKGLKKEERKNIFEHLLHFTALTPFQNRLAGNLSGGMKQKLGLACALLKKPTLLLLDEPSVGVDPLSRRELWQIVHDLVLEGISVLWSTAYLDEAEQCASVLLLDQGRLLFKGNPAALTERVKGRVFKTTPPEAIRRTILREALKQESVVDGTIQGADVRLVFKTTTPYLADLVLTPAAPRFEDAFVDLLGKPISKDSELAQRMPPVVEHLETPVSATELTKRFGSFTAVDHISFSVKKGEIFGLLGPNGAGKSTTFKMLCGLLKPTSGSASVCGLDLQKASTDARSQIGYMAQKFSLYGLLSVKQNLSFFSGIYNLFGKEQKQAIEEMIELFSLTPYLDTSAEILPLGFKQRLALACATMHHPKVLFLDEPTSGVDPLTRREFWHHINGLVEKGVTILITTHFMDEAQYCDRIALIYRGTIIQMETPDRLKEAAKSADQPNPTLESAFIKLIEDYDKVHC